MTSLRLRLLVVLLSALTLVASAMGWATYRSVLAESETLFDYQLQQMALSLRDQGEVAAADAPSLANERLDFVVQVWSFDGRVIYASQPHSAVPGRAQLGLATVQVDGQGWRTYSVATPQRVIQVAQPLSIRRSLAAEAAWRSITPVALLAPLLGATVWLLVTWTLRPLQRMANEVRLRDAQALNALPAQHLPDEVAPLVDAINDLLRRLAEAMALQRDFVADAAHELRSPLTALKLQLHILVHARDAQTREWAQAELEQGMERTSRLVEQLLTLARSEPGAAPLSPVSLDLVVLAQEVLAASGPLASTRGTQLALLGEASARVQGDGAELTSLVRNLVDNAVIHSPPGARVEVSVAHTPAGTVLTVDDSGPGIAPAERQRVFDRFFRRPGSDEPGSGLGLAIVRRVAERHGARLHLDQAPLGGLRVVVAFAEPPAAQAAITAIAAHAVA
jgi:two-component system OmpR family sensor kinase/two-component system sensor histidine kinase QseC